MKWLFDHYIENKEIVIPNLYHFCTNVYLTSYYANMVEHSNCFLTNIPKVIGSFRIVLGLLILFMMSIKLLCNVKWTKEYYSKHVAQLIFLRNFFYIIFMKTLMSLMVITLVLLNILSFLNVIDGSPFNFFNATWDQHGNPLTRYGILKSLIKPCLVWNIMFDWEATWF